MPIGPITYSYSSPDNSAEIRRLRVAVFCVDLVDPQHSSIIPNHRSWQTRSFIERCFTEAGFVPVDPSGRRSAFGSVSDFLTNNTLGGNFDCVVHTYPSNAPVSDGWYEFRLRPGEHDYYGNNVPQDQKDQRSNEFYTAFLSRDDVGVVTPQRTLAQFLREFNCVFLILGGSGGGIRGQFGSSGLGNPSDPSFPDNVVRYDWLGTLFHEMTHIFTGLKDYYGSNWENMTVFDILSVGNFLGVFPSPMAAWMLHMVRFAREEIMMRKGESARISLPVPQLGQPIRMLILDNSSLASNKDEFVVEYREHGSTKDNRYDTRFMGIPPNNNDGLLIVDFDKHARGLFASSWALRNGSCFPNHPCFPNAPTVANAGTLPHTFKTDVENIVPTAWDPGNYSLSPVVEFKRHGGIYSDNNTLFGQGTEFLGSYPNENELLQLKSSANRDGDVVWEFHNLIKEPTGSFSFDVNFQGRSFSTEAVGPSARWISRGYQMGNSADINNPSHGYYFERRTNSETILVLYPDGRKSLDGSTTYDVEGTFLYSVAITGERLTGSFRFGEGEFGVNTVGGIIFRVERTDDPSSNPIAYEGPPFSRIELLRIDNIPAGDDLHEFSIDLTAYAGLPVRITLTCYSTGRPIRMAIVDAYFYRKGDVVLHDFVSRSGLAIADNLSDLQRESEGILRLKRNIKLVDGVTYSNALIMKPQSIQRGIVKFSSISILIPNSGAILRGTVGYPIESITPACDGAIMHLIIDDGIHSIRLRDWTPPLYTTSSIDVAIAQATPGFPERGSPGLGSWGQIVKFPNYWVRIGDFNGDGRDDIAIFTGGDNPRVAVSLSMGNNTFGELTKWHDYFAVKGEYPLVGRFNPLNQNRNPPIYDIITFTGGGEAYVAFSSGNNFGDSMLAGTGLVTRYDVPLIADVDGDGLDDIIIFSREGGYGRPRGSVWVAFNRGGVFPSLICVMENFCSGNEIPLAGTAFHGNRTGIVCVNEDNGDVRVALWNRNNSQFLEYPIFQLYGTGPRRSVEIGSSSPPNLPQGSLFVGNNVCPGSCPTNGPVVFLAKRQGVTHLVWFNHSKGREHPNYPGVDPKGNVFVTAVQTDGPLSSPEKWNSYLSIGTGWPEVGDFTGDQKFDLLNIPRTAIEANENLYPADLYISPKQSILSPLSPPTIPRRTRRFAIDISIFRGKEVKLDVEVDAGPSSNNDIIVWPDLKLYRKEVLANVEIDQ